MTTVGVTSSENNYITIYAAIMLQLHNNYALITNIQIEPTTYIDDIMVIYYRAEFTEDHTTKLF